MEMKKEIPASRKSICIRLLYTLLYLLVFEIIKLFVQITVVFQYIFLLITLEYNSPVRNFSNKLSTYAYEVIRYLTLNNNQRPFPFNDFPEPMEKPEEQVSFR